MLALDWLTAIIFTVNYDLAPTFHLPWNVTVLPFSVHSSCVGFHPVCIVLTLLYSVVLQLEALALHYSVVLQLEALALHYSVVLQLEALTLLLCTLGSCNSLKWSSVADITTCPNLTRMLSKYKLYV